VRARHHPRRFRRGRSINNGYDSKSAQAHLGVLNGTPHSGIPHLLRPLAFLIRHRAASGRCGSEFGGMLYAPQSRQRRLRAAFGWGLTDAVCCGPSRARSTGCRCDPQGWLSSPGGLATAACLRKGGSAVAAAEITPASRRNIVKKRQCPVHDAGELQPEFSLRSAATFPSDQPSSIRSPRSYHHRQSG